MARQGVVNETLEVKGYSELIRSLKTVDARTRRAVRATLRQAGDAVRNDAAGRVTRGKPRDAKTAAGYKVRVRVSGVAVEQSLRKTTGLHPEWGAWQMRHALVPALTNHELDTVARIQHALDEAVAEFNAGTVTV